MRKSTRILISAIVLIAVTLAMYDLNLYAAFKKGDYTNPFSDYTNLDYRGFNEIELDAASAVNIMVVQGPFKVLVNPGAEDFLKVEMRGNRLVVRAAFPDRFRAFTDDYMVYVSCPGLSLLRSDAWYTTGGLRVTDSVARDVNWKPTLLTGFTLDSLVIQADHASNIVLENDRIRMLSSIIGTGVGSGPALTIGRNNHINQSNLDVLHKGRLVIKDAATSDLSYRIADSATLLLNGAVIHQLKNPLQP